MALPEPATSTHATGPALAEFTRRVSAELAGEVPELPSFPDVVLRVQQALARDEVTIDEVVRVVSAEPSLAVRLLQLANSAALNASGQRVITLRAAIGRIGFNLARSATVAFALSQMRRAEAWRGLEAQFRDIWESSAQLAATAHVLARHVRRADADQALLAGMLSSVGRLYVLTRLHAFPGLLGDSALYAEIQRVWQPRAGRAMLARWNLGAEVLDAACEFENAQAPYEGRATLSDVLLAARLLGDANPEGIASAGILEIPAVLRLGLQEADAAAVLAASDSEIASLRAALGD